MHKKFGGLAGWF